MRAIIVGDGPSSSGFVPPDGIAVFAVKRTIRWLARADYWFSLDWNTDSRLDAGNPVPGVNYHAAVTKHDRLPEHVTRWERVSARRMYLPRSVGHESPEWWLFRWGAILGLSKEPGKIHSGNSAYGALGLAHHLGYTDVLLVGIDGTADVRQSDGRPPNNLSHLPLLFQSAMPQIKLATIGGMAGIPHTTLEDWMNGGC